MQVGKQYYYIRKTLKGQQVLLQVDGAVRQFKVLWDGKIIKQVNIKGLYHGVMDWEPYVYLIRQEAESEWQHYLHRRRYSRR